MTAREMEQRLMVLTDRYVAVRARPPRPWACWRCGQTNAAKVPECGRCGSSGAPGDPDSVAEYRALHAQWMAAKA
jgi:hypothetical protein